MSTPSVERISRVRGPIITVQKVEFGTLRYSHSGDGVEIGDIVVPPVIEVEFPGADGQPALFMVIEAIDGIPICTQFELQRVDDGRGIGSKDLQGIPLNSWIEQIVSICSMVITAKEGDMRAATVKVGGAGAHGEKLVGNARNKQRRTMTNERLKKVAEIYNSHKEGGLSAVAAAFQKTERTAARYVQQAREAGLIPK